MLNNLRNRTPLPEPGPSGTISGRVDNLGNITPSSEPGPSGTVPARLKNLRSRLLSNSSDSKFILEKVVEDNLSDDDDKTLKIKEKRTKTSFQDLCPAPVFQPRISQRKMQNCEILTSCVTLSHADCTEALKKR